MLKAHFSLKNKSKVIEQFYIKTMLQDLYVNLIAKPVCVHVHKNEGGCPTVDNTCTLCDRGYTGKVGVVLIGTWVILHPSCSPVTKMQNIQTLQFFSF